MTADVIILSKCINVEDFALNSNCIKSLITSEPNFSFNIKIIESNSYFNAKEFFYNFPHVEVIMPNESFNFNRFLNIGLNLSSEDLIIFSNNDVIFHKNWLTEILKVKQKNKQIQSFCPFDQTSPYLSWKKFNQKTCHIGYRVPIEFVGWCFITERSVFDKTGKFDEQFDLYFQDNDFALTLKKNSILHAMVPYSFVEHIGGYTTKNYDASKTIKYAEDKIKFTKKWKQPYIERFKNKLTSLFSYKTSS